MASQNLEPIDDAIELIHSKTELRPKIGIILGSGLGGISSELTATTTISYQEIPGFPVSTAPSHRGTLHLGLLQDVAVTVMEGRVHLYEGYDPRAVGYPVRLMHRLGVEILLITNAAGGINPKFEVGDLMLVHDHLSMASMAGMDPNRGPHEGERFISLNGAYDSELLNLATDVAKAENIRSHRGVYGYVVGPSFETPSEVRFLEKMGVDAVGMSTVPEVLTARHCGLRVFAVSSITNLSIKDIHSQQQTTVEEVWDAVEDIVPRLTQLLKGMVVGLSA